MPQTAHRKQRGVSLTNVKLYSSIKFINTQLFVCTIHDFTIMCKSIGFRQPTLQSAYAGCITLL